MQKGYIYKIFHEDEKNDTVFYIGSTFKELEERLSQHIAMSKCEKHSAYFSKFYKYVRDKCEEGFKIEAVKAVDVPDRKDLRMEEEKIRKLLSPELNTISAYRSVEDDKQKNKDYYEKNKEKYRHYYAEYYRKNKEKLDRRNKENRLKAKLGKESFSVSVTIEIKIVP